MERTTLGEAVGGTIGQLQEIVPDFVVSISLVSWGVGCQHLNSEGTITAHKKSKNQ